jgi:hypothetical protein
MRFDIPPNPPGSNSSVVYDIINFNDLLGLVFLLGRNSSDQLLHLLLPVIFLLVLGWIGES